MPTKNPRVNITLEESEVGLLSDLAKKEGKSVSRLAKELILESLERREDIVFSKIAESRDIKNTKKVLHEDAWGK